MKRTPLKRTGSIAPVSKRRQHENRLRRQTVERLVEERGVMCQARLPRCDWLAVDAHEVLARSAGGSITDADNIILVCRSCHDRIGSHPQEATRLGLRKSRYGTHTTGDDDGVR